MKGEEAEYTMNLKKAKMFPKRERMVKALGTLKDFVRKHTRAKSIVLATEVNEYLHKNSKNIPEKASIVLRKKDNEVTVFLKGGKQLEEAKKKEAEEKKKKKDKEAEKEKDKKETKKTIEQEEEKKEEERKLKEKREKEKAGTAVEMKRKTGKN